MCKSDLEIVWRGVHAELEVKIELLHSLLLFLLQCEAVVSGERVLAD